MVTLIAIKWPFLICTLLTIELTLRKSSMMPFTFRQENLLSQYLHKYLVKRIKPLEANKTTSHVSKDFALAAWHVKPNAFRRTLTKKPPNAD